MWFLLRKSTEKRESKGENKYLCTIMEQFYRVAGLAFAVSMDDSHPLWAHMPNYQPFEQEVPSGELLFRLTVTDGMELPKTEPYYKEDPDRPDMPRVMVYRHSDGTLSFSMKPTAKQPDAYLLDMSADFTHGTLHLHDSGQFQKFAIDNSLMLMFTMSTTGLDTLAMHASVVMHGGMGYMFLGLSGTGKSTHSRLWLENIPDCQLLNDDNPVVRIMPDGKAWVYGTPWSGKTPCYKNEQVPVGGIVLIRRCKHNAVSRLSIPEAFAALLMSCSGLKFSQESTDRLTHTQSKLLGAVPFYVMDCLPDADAAVVCHQGVCKKCK